MTRCPRGYKEDPRRFKTAWLELTYKPLGLRGIYVSGVGLQDAEGHTSLYEAGESLGAMVRKIRGTGHLNDESCFVPGHDLGMDRLHALSLLRWPTPTSFIQGKWKARGWGLELESQQAMTQVICKGLTSSTTLSSRYTECVSSFLFLVLHEPATRVIDDTRTRSRHARAAKRATIVRSRPRVTGGRPKESYPQRQLLKLPSSGNVRWNRRST